MFRVSFSCRGKSTNLFILHIRLSRSPAFMQSDVGLCLSVTELVTIFSCDKLKLHPVCPVAHGSQITWGQRFIRNSAQADNALSSPWEEEELSDIKVRGDIWPSYSNQSPAVSDIHSHCSFSFTVSRLRRQGKAETLISSMTCIIHISFYFISILYKGYIYKCNVNVILVVVDIISITMTHNIVSILLYMIE